MTQKVGLPRWLKVANPVIVASQRRGLVVGTMRLLSVPGGRSGELRTSIPREVPQRVQFFRHLYGVSGEAEEFAALAPRCPVFRVEGEGR